MNLWASVFEIIYRVFFFFKIKKYWVKVEKEELDFFPLIRIVYYIKVFSDDLII